MKEDKKNQGQKFPIIIIFIVLVTTGFIVYNRVNNTPFKPIKYVSTVKYTSENLTLDNISDYDGKIIKNAEDFNDFQNNYNIKVDIKDLDFSNNYYIIVFAENDYCGGSINGIRSVEANNSKIKIDIGYNGSCGPCPREYTLYIVPIEKSKINDANIMVNYKYTVENKYHCDPGVAYKPMIYLYPKEKMDIKVKLMKPENLTTTYPKYEDSWDVTAFPSGDLIDKKTNRSLYGLYWEGINNYSKLEKEGFVVKGKDTIPFLEENLAKLGLTEREANEFIVYWLPKLKTNNYNYIHFSSIETINSIMPIEVYPKPDTTIRVLMEYKPLEKPINVKKQEIKTPERKGFTLVEWGGTKIS